MGLHHTALHSLVLLSMVLLSMVLLSRVLLNTPLHNMGHRSMVRPKGHIKMANPLRLLCEAALLRWDHRAGHRDRIKGRMDRSQEGHRLHEEDHPQQEVGDRSVIRGVIREVIRTRPSSLALSLYASRTM
jgi:hypothetical protein